MRVRETRCLSGKPHHTRLLRMILCPMPTLACADVREESSSLEAAWLPHFRSFWLPCGVGTSWYRLFVWTIRISVQSTYTSLCNLPSGVEITQARNNYKRLELLWSSSFSKFITYSIITNHWRDNTNSQAPDQQSKSLSLESFSNPPHPPNQDFGNPIYHRHEAPSHEFPSPQSPHHPTKSFESSEFHPTVSIEPSLGTTNLWWTHIVQTDNSTDSVGHPNSSADEPREMGVLGA